MQLYFIYLFESIKRGFLKIGVPHYVSEAVRDDTLVYCAIFVSLFFAAVFLIIIFSIVRMQHKCIHMYISIVVTTVLIQFPYEYCTI